MELTEIRRTLAEARILLAAFRDAYANSKAQAETEAINAASGSYGKNELERERFLLLAIQHDHLYQHQLGKLSLAETNVLRLEAALEVALDERREREWALRARLITLLERGDLTADAVLF